MRHQQEPLRRLFQMPQRLGSIFEREMVEAFAAQHEFGARKLVFYKVDHLEVGPVVAVLPAVLGNEVRHDIDAGIVARKAQRRLPVVISARRIEDREDPFLLHQGNQSAPQLAGRRQGAAEARRGFGVLPDTFLVDGRKALRPRRVATKKQAFLEREPEAARLPDHRVDQAASSAASRP